MSSKTTPAATGSFWRQKLRSTSPHQVRARLTSGSAGARGWTSCGTRMCWAMAYLYRSILAFSTNGQP